MRVFVHENYEKKDEINNSSVFNVQKKDNDNIYVFNKLESGFLYIILAIKVQTENEEFKKEISIYSLERHIPNNLEIFSDENIECCSSDREPEMKENLLLINSIYENCDLNDILLDKYIIMLPGGGIVIKAEGYNSLAIIYNKQKI